MADVLVVPVSLAALYLAEDVDVVGAADFTRLPYVDPLTGRDMNSGTPYVSEVILPDPLQDQSFPLQAGVHLHWTLPDALTRLVQRDGTTRAPTVPNRWLVTRRNQGKIEKSWVVESDYLAAPTDTAAAGIAFPVPGDVPFRRLGRAVPLADWNPGLPGDRLPQVTAIGHGEAAFAAFYPDCHSVFGFHDADFASTPPPNGIQYEVAGWFSSPAQDTLADLTTGPDWRVALSSGFAWTVPEGSARPTSTVCFASLLFRPDGRTVSPLLHDQDAGVYVGTTATEALAAHLGAELGGDPDQVENLLEALAYADELEATPLDVGIRLAEERHADGFRPLPSGELWTIRREDAPNVDAPTRQRREALTLSHAIGDLLNALNTAQETLDRARGAQVSLREQLFADWYKYMICAYPAGGARESYPDPDEVRSYLGWWMAHLTGQDGVADEAELAFRAARAAMAAALKTYNVATAVPNGATFVLDAVPAPQYHLPAEPVVLLTGQAATPSDRHGQDGTLACQVLSVTDPRDPVALQKTLPGAGFVPDVWAHNPWHPVLLEWEVEFLATGGGDNLGPSDSVYDPAYLTQAYELVPGEVDLRTRPGFEAPTRAASVYAGRTVLSQSAKPVLSARVLRYLAGTVVDSYNTAHGTTLAPADFQAAPDTVLTWYDAHGEDARLKTLVAVYQHLAEHEDSNLAQVLGGFNDALLMRRLTRQLPIADPLGFPAYQEFARQVAAAVGDDTRHAPEPLSAYNPIRAGVMRLSRLRMVDNFGQCCDVDVDSAATTTQLRVPDRPGWVAMPPRLTQPSRLSFRWLDSDHELREMNDVPVTSPVCGWVVPDDLNGGLAFYDEDGVELGLLTADPEPSNGDLARWLASPGSTVTGIPQIGNAHLKAVAARLQALGPDPFAAFVAALDILTSGVEPEDQSLDVFTIRPLAVLRAELDLQLMGLPAVHQDWNVFRQDLRRTTRDSNGYPAVVFPVRVGSAARLNDGLIGYWREDPALFLGLGDFVPVTTAPPLAVGPGQEAHILTMLVDPRAPVHLTSGFLPAQAISLPADQYRTAMEALRVPEFTAPVLVDGDSLALPVPSVAGHRWTWRERGPATWTDRQLDPVHNDAGLPTLPTAREGWLTLVPDTE
ncbi:hypothetical protein [Kineosporia babensis]|uniref:Uncharacterized protein n=1 Tax=Kineosporia babensis TaxID=499548 RepID=A0A9X1SWX7_9ACTN|nr:hypothetical protein [Kineosporia babensis]MCD5315204.1 hypothetical protein [Kineosporia babensis]